jgi:pilus assembly protein Flp/PilA
MLLPAASAVWNMAVPQLSLRSFRSTLLGTCKPTLGLGQARRTFIKQVGCMNSIRITKRLRAAIRGFLRSEDGPTAVEYAVMLALIIIFCLTSINSIGTRANTTFQKAATSLQSAS